MQIIVSAVEEGGSTDDIEDQVSEELSDWLTTLAGWGLLSTLVPVEKVRHIIAALLYTNANWNESTGGPRTDLKVFDAVKYVYSHVPGKGVHDVVPRLGVWFQELRPSSKLHSVLICHSSVTQSFFLFFTFFMTSIAFKVHINDN